MAGGGPNERNRHDEDRVGVAGGDAAAGVPRREGGRRAAGPGGRGEACYRKLDKGDRVVVRYQVVLEVKDGRTNAVGLHFLDADRVPKGSQAEVAK